MPRRGREDTIRASHSTWFKGVLGAAAEMTKQAVEISKGLGKQAVEAYDEWRSEDDEQPALCYQVITAAGKFDKVHMDDSISGLEPTDKFVVCGIMGPQNTGKSTLLNFLFGTNFVMHEEDVLHQCTKGAWLSSSDLPLDPDRESASTSAQPKALVLDLEGADGIERGTDKSLERRLALFAMVVTDTLIINTLASTVGLADGGCVPLLTMVFQEKIRLLEKQLALLGTHGDSMRNASASPAGTNLPRTCILIVFRNVEGDFQHKAQSKYKPKFEEMLATVWSSVQRPGCLSDLQLHECFKVEYAGLPDYTHSKAAFKKGCKSLAARLDPANRKGIFAGRPRGGFINATCNAQEYANYSHGMWQKILSNEAFELPSAVDMVHRAQCDNLVAAVYIEFSNDPEVAQLKIQAGTGRALPDFKPKVEALLQTWKAELLERAKFCREEIAMEAAEDLLRKIVLDLRKALEMQVTVQEDALLKAAQKKFVGKTTDEHLSIIDESQQALQDWWKCNIPDGAYEIADIETYLSRLAVGLNRMAQEECERQLEKKQQDEKHTSDKETWAKEVEGLKKSKEDWCLRSENAVKMNDMFEDDMRQAPEDSASMKILRKICEAGIDGMGPFSSAQSLAEDYMGAKYSSDAARCRAMINFESGKAFAKGALLGMGGFATMAVTIPADMLVGWAMEARLAAAIAIIYGHSLSEDAVRTTVILSLLGENLVTDVVKTAGITLTRKVSAAVIKKIPGRALIAINKRVGFRLITKAGGKGIFNLLKWVPIFGGIMGGAISTIGMLAAGATAVKLFAEE